MTAAAPVPGDVGLGDIEAARVAVERIAVRTPLYNCRVLERADGLTGRPQGGEPPADRLVQDPRGLREACRPRRGSLARHRRRLGGQPRPGGRVRGALGGCALRGVHARGGVDLQGRRDDRLRRLGPSRGRVARRLRPARRGASSETGLHFVHPFDDPAIVAGQGTLGLELVEDVEDLAMVIVPLGGGGLVSGIACAIDAWRPTRQGRGRSSRGLRAVPRRAPAERIEDGGRWADAGGRDRRETAERHHRRG